MLHPLSESSLEGILEVEHEETTHDHSDDGEGDEDENVDQFHHLLGNELSGLPVLMEDPYVNETSQDEETGSAVNGDVEESEDMGYEDMDYIPRRNPQEVSLASVLQRQSSKRSSLMRRVSTESELTSQSAPAMVGGQESDLAGLVDSTTQRRVTVHGRSADSSSSLRSGRFRISSRAMDHASGGSNSSLGKSSFVSTLIQRRRSTRQNRHSANTNGIKSISPHQPAAPSVADAVERLSSLPTSDVEYVSAAAAVVAATAPGKRNNFCQFSQGDHVLVVLALLSLADVAGNKDLYTVDPVNQQGYPRSGGKNETSHQPGPFLYVLCVVTQVHFDEDERYYTVRRCDTGTEQRADPGYMEPIRDPEAIEAAYEAAMRTHLAVPQGPDQDRRAPFAGTRQTLFRWRNAVTRRVVPWYQRLRQNTKMAVQQMLHGEAGWALHVRFSGINFLVCCSLIFLFHDVFALAFVPASYDFSFMVLGLYV
jgi:hypothetical protein